MLFNTESGVLTRRSARKENTLHAVEATELVDEFRRLDSQRHKVWQDFNQTPEPELIDASIYRMKALESEMEFLVRRARELGVSAEEIAHVTSE